MPPVTNSAPVADRDVACLNVHVTEGVAEPTRMALIFETVMATSVKKNGKSSDPEGFSMT